MRHRRLLHGKSSLEIAHADLTATSYEDLENREADGMSQELEVGADTFQRFQIDQLSRPHGATSAARAFREIRNGPATAPCHVRIVTNVLIIVNMFGMSGHPRYAAELGLFVPFGDSWHQRHRAWTTRRI